MAQIHVETKRTIAATPDEVWSLVADYETGRPRYLPPNYLDWRVEEGGKGSGTKVTYRLQAARRVRPYQLQVEEPTPGWVLVERDANSSLMNTWTLEPSTDGSQTTVKVTSDWTGGTGIGGFMERTFAPGGLRRIYDDLLERLARTAERGTSQG